MDPSLRPATVDLQHPRADGSTVDWRAAFALVLITAAAYVPILHAGFIWDDNNYLGQHEVLWRPNGLWQIWAGDTVQYYPLVFSTFWVELRLWGLNPAGFHAVNLLLHAAGAVLLWLALRRIGVPAAWLVAAVFAVHPIQVESVGWITERKNVLSGFLYLAAANCYLCFDDRGGRRWYVAAFILFVLALFSKTVTCSLPVALLIVRWYRERPIRPLDVLRLLPFLVVGAAMGRVTAWYETHVVGASGPEWAMSLGERILIAGRALWFYPARLLWLVDLSFIYPRWQIDPHVATAWIWPATAIVALGTTWFARHRIGRGPFAGAAFYGVTIFPALGFVNVYPMRYSFVADHFQYLAGLGIIAPIVGGTWQWMRRRTDRASAPRIGLAAGTIVIIALAGLTHHRAGAFESLETLWTDTLKKNPDCEMAWVNLGDVHFRAGRVARALECFDRALAISPRDHEAVCNRANALRTLGRIDEAVAAYEAALRIRPNMVPALVNLSLILSAQNKISRAESYAQTAVRIDPQSAEGHFALARVRVAQGRRDDAITEYRAGLAVKPNTPAARVELDRLESALTPPPPR